MEWLGENQWAAWLALSVALGIAELFSLDLVLIMLATGAAAGLLTSLGTDSVIAQVLVASLASVAMLAVVRPSLVRRLHGGPELVLGHNRLIGARTVTPVRLSVGEPGQLQISGEQWTAVPYDDTLVIAAGQTVEVLEIRGATAYVHPIATLEP